MLRLIVHSLQSQEVITKETLELIANQTFTTQLVIVLIIVIVVGGSIAFFTLRGGLAVFKELSSSIIRANEIHEELSKVVKDHDLNAEKRFTKTSDLFNAIDSDLKDVELKIMELKEVISNNPNDEKMYRLLMKVYRNLETAKEDTDEIEVLKDV